MLEILELISFGHSGWGSSLLISACVTFAVALCGYGVGMVIGAMLTWARLSGRYVVNITARLYIMIFRGVPELLVIYLVYFGGSLFLTKIFNLFKQESFVGMSPFMAGVVAIGMVSGGYQAEIFRSAYRALSTGEIEAAKSVGMGRFLLFRRIIAPQIFIYALPGFGNIWQMALKESALISVTGLVELVRQSQIAAGSTRKPFEFFLIAMLIFLIVTFLSQLVFDRLEKYTSRSLNREGA